jgi:hypothetical protein
MKIDSHSVREFREIYLFSNTPLYLFKKLRQLQAVQQLAQNSDAKELFEEYLRRVKEVERTLDDVAIAYACLVALTYKERREAISIFQLINPIDLQWVSAIRDLYFIKLPIENTSSIKIVNHQIPIFRLGKDATSSSAYTETPKPTIEQKENI